MAVFSAAFGVLLSAQAGDPYLELVRTYRTDPSAAALSVSRLSSGAIKDGMRRCVASAGGLESG